MDLLQKPGLSQDAPVSAFRQVIRRLARDCNFAGLGRVFEVTMATFLGNRDPAIVLQSPDHVPDFDALKSTRAFASRRGKDNG